eukprot:6482320-Amphidinium_carterae.1
MITPPFSICAKPFFTLSVFSTIGAALDDRASEGDDTDKNATRTWPSVSLRMRDRSQALEVRLVAFATYQPRSLPCYCMANPFLYAWFIASLTPAQQGLSSLVSLRPPPWSDEDLQQWTVGDLAITTGAKVAVACEP